MKIGQPVSLLLSGLLAASGLNVGVTSVVAGDARPAAREANAASKPSTFIGRLFHKSERPERPERPARLDNAETPNRNAGREKQIHPEILKQLQQLSERDSPRPTEGTTDPVIPKESESVARSSGEAANSKHPEGSGRPSGTTSGQVKNAVASVQAISADADQASGTSTGASVKDTPAKSTPLKKVAWKAASVTVVSEAEVLAAADFPADNADLLLNALRHGDTLETQCLAAALLGDCDTGDLRVSDALEQACRSAQNPRLRLAVADSRIQRHESDATTATCLIELAQQTSEDVRLPAISDLRIFSGTESARDCIDCLRSLLDHEDSGIRALAALTLGDFAELDEPTSAQLSRMATEDKNEDVRNAAKASTEQRKPAAVK